MWLCLRRPAPPLVLRPTGVSLFLQPSSGPHDPNYAARVVDACVDLFGVTPVGQELGSDQGAYQRYDYDGGHPQDWPSDRYSLLDQAYPPLIGTLVRI